MKIKINFGYKNVIIYSFIIFVIANLVCVFYLYKFLKKNLYDTISYQINSISSTASINKVNINVEKFNSVINNIENKQKPKEPRTISNIIN